MTYLFLFLVVWALVGSERLPKLLGLLLVGVVLQWIMRGFSWFIELFPESQHDHIFMVVILTLVGLAVFVTYWCVKLSDFTPARERSDSDRS